MYNIDTFEEARLIDATAKKILGDVHSYILYRACLAGSKKIYSTKYLLS
jgi:hypothetical protein